MEEVLNRSIRSDYEKESERVRKRAKDALAEIHKVAVS